MVVPILLHPDPESARNVAEQFELPVTEEPPSDNALVLGFADGRLELRDRTTRPGRGLFVEFDTQGLRRGSASLSKKQPLARAIGRNGKTVLDATAGLGRDTSLLCGLGFTVTAAERSAPLAALLADGIARATSGDWPHNVPTLVHGDVRDVLKTGDAFDVIYIDPMFPPRRKSSALAKKSIRWVRDIVGDDPDASLVLEAALQANVDRVVFKRPNDAPRGMETADGQRQPDLSFGGKLVRYDVYLVGR